MGVFLDWCSIYQKDPALFDAAETPEAKAEGAERAAFVADLKAGRAFYGGVAYEESRTAEQKAAFRRALHDTMDVWYAHQMIVTVFVTRLPAGFSGRTYEDRGWVRARRCSPLSGVASACVASPPCADPEDRRSRLRRRFSSARRRSSSSRQTRTWSRRASR